MNIKMNIFPPLGNSLRKIFRNVRHRAKIENYSKVSHLETRYIDATTDGLFLIML